MGSRSKGRRRPCVTWMSQRKDSIAEIRRLEEVAGFVGP